MNTSSEAFQATIRQITVQSLAMLSTLSVSQAKTIRSTESLAVSGPIALPVPHWPDSLEFARQIAKEMDNLVPKLLEYQKNITSLIATAEAS